MPQSAAPSLRWLTRKNLLDQPASQPEARADYQAIRTEGSIPAILREQDPEGWWEHRRHYYSPKFTATHWSMLLLAELDAAPELPGVRLGAEFMLAATQKEVEQHLQENTQKYICFYDNLLRYTIHAGLLEDPRVQRVLDYVNQDTRLFRFRCSWNGDLPCAWGAVRALWGLAAVPPERRSPQVEETIAAGLGWTSCSTAAPWCGLIIPHRGKSIPIGSGSISLCSIPRISCSPCASSKSWGLSTTPARAKPWFR